jgi:hypothetical protein
MAASQAYSNRAMSQSPQKRNSALNNVGKRNSTARVTSAGPELETRMREDGKGTYQAPKLPSVNIEIEELSDCNEVAEEVKKMMELKELEEGFNTNFVKQTFKGDN